MLKFELDHFLVEHTVEQAPVIADAVNQRDYDVIYFELCTDEATQSAHQQLLNEIVSGTVEADTSIIPERDAHLHIASYLVQDSASVVVIDHDFGLKKMSQSLPSTIEGAFDKRVINAKHSIMREPMMAEQIAHDITINRTAGQAGAIITGALHDGVDDHLQEIGLDVQPHRVGVAEEYRLSRNPDWSIFEDISLEFVFAIEYALRHGANIEETRQVFLDVIASSKK